MFCSECGIKLADTAKFCSGCGVTQQPVHPPIPAPVESHGVPAYGVHITPDQMKLNAGKSSAELVYIMYALSCLTILPAFIGIFIAYGKLSELKGTYLESHFQWQIQTFWRYFGWCVVVLGILFFPIPLSGESILIKLGLGTIAAIAGAIWLVYRIVKGWMRLSEYKTIDINQRI
jgi:uncharacterized membrane protein